MRVLSRLACHRHVCQRTAPWRGGGRALSTGVSSRSTPPILFVMGGPGAGKGTQSTLLTAEFGGEVSGTGDGTVVPADVQSAVAAKYPPLPRGGSERRFGAVHISVGALLRAELKRHQAGQVSPWSLAIKEALDKGVILPGSITVQLLAQEMQRVAEQQRSANPNLRTAFLVDGFPRSADNVQHFQSAIAPITHILNLQCADTTLIQRVMNRAALSAASAVAGVGSVGGGRSDDRYDVVLERLRVFRGESEGVMKWWREECERRRMEDGVGWMYDVDGEKSIEEVYHDVRRVYLEFIKQYTE